MARVTIEDCEKAVANRFELVMLAAERVKQINKGSKPLVAHDDNKSVVIALREIAADKIGVTYPSEEVVALPEPSLEPESGTSTSGEGEAPA